MKKQYCDCCDSELSKEDYQFTTGNHETICYDCRSSEYRKCMKCDRLVLVSDIFYSEDDEYLCGDCIGDIRGRNLVTTTKQ